MSESVEIRLAAADDAGAISSQALWQPRAGAEADLVVRGLPPDEHLRVITEASDILARCLPPVPAVPAQRTGLVVGYVQSGKTLSFTTVAALARDNGFAIVVVVAGISELLLEQSRDRLREDLELDRADAYRRWLHFKSPTLEGNDRVALEDALADWRDANLPAHERPTILVTVMKNWVQVGKLADVLARLRLDGLTALVIDDEADQASLNTRVRSRQESSTYYQLMRLRQVLPRHTLLQYTATPQAPLLISITDSLSPDFICVLTPGPAYVGGNKFFEPGSLRIKLIPSEDERPLNELTADPPPGLIEALKVYFLGVSADQLSNSPAATRSMLIHPSRTTDPHARFETWVNSTRRLWQEVLALPDSDATRIALAADFAGAYAELSRTVPQLPDLGQLLTSLPRWLRRTKVETVNAVAGRAPEIRWESAYSWILIGGQLMDRGFTVKGLTVTYMPRPIGIGNADTIQQRARFLGYKRDYFDYCRVYVDATARDAYEHYVRHEQQMRKDLIEYARTGRHLSEWKRAFLLDRTLRPTRASVLKDTIHQSVFSDTWFTQNYPQANEDVSTANRAIVASLRANAGFADDPGRDDRREGQRHLVAQLPLGDLLDTLLTRYVVANGSDSAEYTGLLMQLSAYVDEDTQRVNERTSIYMIRNGRLSRRALSDAGSVEQIFQGADVDDRSRYGGDASVHADELTVQIHNLELHTKAGQSLFTGVPALAIWVPSRMAAGWLVQASAS